MSKRLMAVVTMATMAAVMLPAASHATGLRGDHGVRKGCVVTKMMNRTKRLFMRPVIYRKSHTKWRLFGNRRKAH
jgi:hypothetical protein